LEQLKACAGESPLIRTARMKELKIFYKDIKAFIENGYLEKIRQGYYRLIGAPEEEPTEAQIIKALFPEGVLCMNTALFHYGYSDRTPLHWDIAIDRNVSKARFHIDYPYVKPYYMDAAHLKYGLIKAEYDNCIFNIFDRDRLLCECIRNENKMDREIYNKAIQGYVNDSQKSIANLIAYARKRKILKKVMDRIGVWL
jgi:predicted transcriptional regulator of viral defense system